MSAIDYTPFEVLTFDCYGTLIDWEAGLRTALQPLQAAAGIGDEARGCVAPRGQEPSPRIGPPRLGSVGMSRDAGVWLRLRITHDAQVKKRTSKARKIQNAMTTTSSRG